MTEMTSRERIMAALRRRDVDYVPCCIVFNSLLPAQRKGYEWRFPWPESASPETELEYQVRQLGLDQIVGFASDLVRPVPGVKSKTWLDGTILHKVFTTPSGDLHASVNYNELWPYGEDIHLHSDFNVGHFVEPWIENEADLECIKHIMSFCDSKEAVEKTRSSFAVAKRLADKYNLATMASVGSGLTGAQHLFGVTELCAMTIDNPGLVHAYLEHEHQINLRSLEILGELGVDIIRRNGFYETADFYGAEMLGEFIGGRVCREADAARSAGMLSSYTIHTGIMPILDYLRTLTVDSFFGIDMAFQNMDPAKLQNALGENKSFWIGPSSAFHLWKGTEDVRRSVRQTFEIFGGTGLILSPCVSVHSIMPWENTLAMIDEWKKIR